MAMVLLAQINPFFFTPPPPIITGEVISVRNTVITDIKIYLFYATAHEKALYFPAPNFTVFCHHPGRNLVFGFGEFKQIFLPSP